MFRHIIGRQQKEFYLTQEILELVFQSAMPYVIVLFLINTNHIEALYLPE